MPSAKSRRILRAMMAMQPVVDKLDVSRQRRAQDRIGLLVRPPQGMRFTSVPDASIPMLWAQPANDMPQARAVLHCHGGAYISGTLQYAKVLAALFADASGLNTLTFEYRLAPEHPYPAALEDALCAWEFLLAQGYAPHNIAVVGESAGGNLALALALRLRGMGHKLPGLLALLSPWADLTLSGASINSLAGIDPSLTKEGLTNAARAYSKGHDVTDPLISPLFADFRGFPPTLVQVGTREILLSDSVRLVEQMQAANVEATLETWEGMCHVFQLFPFAESDAALKRLGRFIQRLSEQNA